MTWNDPYLETCCRSALHRLILAAGQGRPATEKDAPCLHRLTGMGLASARPDERFVATIAGADRHALEIMRLPTSPRAA